MELPITRIYELRDGMKVTCKVDGITITDAEISIDPRNHDVFLCQDLVKGSDFCRNQKWYKYAIFLGDFNGGEDEEIAPFNKVTELKTNW